MHLIVTTIVRKFETTFTFPFMLRSLLQITTHSVYKKKTHSKLLNASPLNATVMNHSAKSFSPKSVYFRQTVMD